ncbi:hypothetical protein I5I61_21595 [Pseudomonas nitroreducens]|uniref:Uncharacterized protein n=1 Tax=Pseudomonas nitroreducens TaxID=46680 RepID=A0ABS0KQ27_PSENT|nr:hypothetical protein [Pseudomonas nitroreducens]MBG6290058.1 hypothetical protein [Pseudomonas nitroreducens]
MEDRDKEFMKAAVTAFLCLVPALAEEIEQGVPAGSTRAERDLHRQQKGWAELCQSARRAGIEPMEYARQVVILHRSDQRKRVLN